MTSGSCGAMEMATFVTNAPTKSVANIPTIESVE
jgi:hypothetical protein